jgi:hypothetical protein
VKGPYERYYYEQKVADLRMYGLMYDDQLHIAEPVVESPAQLRANFLVGIIERFKRLIAYRMQPFAYEMPTAW